MTDTRVLPEEIAATNISLDEYMERYAADGCEFIEGMVIRVSPSELRHVRLIYFLHRLFDAYFEVRPIGTVIGQPFVMRLPAFPNRRREPDLLVVLKSSPHELKDTYLDGPADICVEVVSEDSGERDHGEKFIEYEKGGVNEYWIVDPLRQESRFYHRDENGRYRRQIEDAEGNYYSRALPGLAVHVPTLWQEQLPGPAATVDMVRAMLAKG